MYEVQAYKGFCGTTAGARGFPLKGQRFRGRFRVWGFHLKAKGSGDLVSKVKSRITPLEGRIIPTKTPLTESPEPLT